MGQESRQRFEIPPGTAEFTLTLLAQQADTPLLFPYDKVRGASTHAVDGEYTLEQALAVMLHGTDLEGRLNSQGVLTIDLVLREQTGQGESAMAPRKRRGSFLARTAAALAVLLSGGAAHGQDSDQPGATRAREPDQIEEIVVTAQRREENLQKIPVAISAFSEADLARSDLNSLAKLQFQVPGMIFASSSSNAQVTLRGVGVELPTLAGESGIALNIDGIYQSRNYVSSGIYDDLERVEVLRGPQGTLYGRNTTGGAMNLWTKTPPEETEAELAVLLGDNDRIRTRGAVGGSINEQLGIRLSYATDQDDGVRRNIYDGDKIDATDHGSVRGALRYTPTEDLEILLRADWARDRDGGPVFAYGTQVLPFGPLVPFGASPPDDAQHLSVDRPTSDARRVWGVSSMMTMELHELPMIGDATLKSITSYRRSEWDREDDTDGADIDWFFIDLKEISKVWSQELTLSSAGDGRLEWVVGAYYFKDRAHAIYDDELNVFGGIGQGILAGGGTPFDVLGAGLLDSLTFDFGQDTEAWALFGQATYHVTDRLRATAGVRYSDEDKDFKQMLSLGIPGLETVPGFGHDIFLCQGLESDDDWSRWTPKFAVDYDVTDDVMAYASASRGFKAGGMNPAGCLDDYDQEVLWAYEVGVKSQWFGNRLRLNLVGFFYDYEDFQANVFVANASVIENAADAEVLGFEAELQALPFEGLQLTAGLSIQNAEFEDYISDDPFTGVPRDLEGNQLPRAPDQSFFIGAEYTLPVSDLGTASLSYEFAWTDDYHFTSFNESFSQQSSYSLSNARLVFATAGGRLEDRFGDWEVHLFVNNVGDKDHVSVVVDAATFSGSSAQYAEPRRYGLELRYRFP